MPRFWPDLLVCVSVGLVATVQPQSPGALTPEKEVAESLARSCLLRPQRHQWVDARGAMCRPGIVPAAIRTRRHRTLLLTARPR